MATVSFPSGDQGLSAYKELVEYAKRHLHEWTKDELEARQKLRGFGEFRAVDSWNKHMNKCRRWYRSKVLGPALQDQHANSVADLAAVMQRQNEVASKVEKTTTEERKRNDEALLDARDKLAEYIRIKNELEGKTDDESLKKYKDAKREKLRLQRLMKKPAPAAALAHEYHVMNDSRQPTKKSPLRTRLANRNRPLTTMAGVKIEWAHLTDKEFAQEWPETVEHAEMRIPKGRSRSVATTAIGRRKEEAVPELEERKKEAEEQQTTPPPQETRTAMQRIVDRLRFGTADPGPV